MGKINKPYGEIGFQKEGYEKGGTAIVGTQPHEKRSNVDDIENAGNPQASETSVAKVDGKVTALASTVEDLGTTVGGLETTVGNIVRLPTFPTTTDDKTYVLKLVDGTLTWVEEVPDTPANPGEE